jgi:hypothetical protein
VRDGRDPHVPLPANTCPGGYAKYAKYAKARSALRPTSLPERRARCRLLRSRRILDRPGTAGRGRHAGQLTGQRQQQRRLKGLPRRCLGAAGSDSGSRRVLRVLRVPSRASLGQGVRDGRERPSRTLPPNTCPKGYAKYAKYVKAPPALASLWVPPCSRRPAGQPPSQKSQKMPWKSRARDAKGSRFAYLAYFAYPPGEVSDGKGPRRPVKTSRTLPPNTYPTGTRSS